MTFLMPERPAESSPPTILVVDDDLGLLRLIEKALKRDGYTVATAASGLHAITWLGEHRADLLLLDLKLQDIEGLELINQLEAIGRPTPFVIITGQGDERVAVEMMRRGALDYLVKDAQFQQFMPTVVRRALTQLQREHKLSATEEALRHSEAILAKAQQIAQLGSYEIELGLPPKARWSEQVFRILGVEPGAVEPLSDDFFNRCVHPDDRDRVRAVIEEGLREAHGWKFQYRILRPDGEVRHVQSSSEAVPNGGQTRKIIGTMLDITERRRLEQEILNISEQEQRRIGQDLHDGICQQLAGIELMSQVLEQSLAIKSRKHSTQAGQIAAHVRETIAQTRMLAHGLCPVVLESEGLMSALQELAHATSKMFGVDCALRCDHPVQIHDNATATHLYRIAQEAVSNAIKHGKSRHIEIGLAAETSRVFLAVKDDGCGIPATPPRTGAGLRIMQYRAGMIGGSVIIQRGETRGTTVACSVHQPSPPARKKPAR
ncbi:MAG: response regulator [Verrucomicrobia bacterium]|nr:response regulator [Verrucomicrobiota bacterium]